MVVRVDSPASKGFTLTHHHDKVEQKDARMGIAWLITAGPLLLLVQPAEAVDTIYAEKRGRNGVFNLLQALATCSAQTAGSAAWPQSFQPWRQESGSHFGTVQH